MKSSTFNKWFSANKQFYIQMLQKYILINTSSPNEHKAWSFLFHHLSSRGFQVKKQPVSSKIWRHPFHCSRSLSKIHKGSFNVIAKRDFGAKKTIIINCHIDVVPFSNFRSFVKNNKIYGRGACDNKNNFVMVLGALDYLSHLKLSPNRNLIFHLPIEEEIGGNGTLSLVLKHSEEVEGAIVFEPTHLKVFRGHRGCLTFQIDLLGKQKHMGMNEKGISAIDLAMKVIESLKKIEADLLKQARSNLDFAKWKFPLQLNIGTIHGGEWHGSLPEKVTITGNLGFLPTHSIADIMETIGKTVEKSAQKHGGRALVFFNGLKNDAYIMPKNETIAEAMMKACNDHNVKQEEMYGWNVSCDARTYYNELGIPTIIFGCGHLKEAHSIDENVTISELKKGIEILSDFLLRK